MNIELAIANYFGASRFHFGAAHIHPALIDVYQFYGSYFRNKLNTKMQYDLL
jgi:hypothetical protein